MDKVPDTRKTCRMQMPIGDGYVIIDVPWYLTEEDWQDVSDLVALMKRTCARKRAEKAASMPEITSE